MGLGPVSQCPPIARATERLLLVRGPGGQGSSGRSAALGRAGRFARPSGGPGRLRPLAAPVPPRLSRREVECLRLVARGKTDWEIARILKSAPAYRAPICERTRAAYDAVSRTQIVVYGLRDAWISFEDAIPPDKRMGGG